MLREQALDELATYIVEGMDLKSCVQLCTETIIENLDTLPDADLENEFLEIIGDTITIDSMVS